MLSPCFIFILSALFSHPVTLLMPEEQAGVPVPHPRGYVALRVQQALHIDGLLSKREWQAAPWSEEFLDIKGPAAAVSVRGAGCSQCTLRPCLSMGGTDNYHLVVGLKGGYM